MNTNKQRGLSLIELLVALSIGAFLIIGAVTVQSQTRKTFAVNEAQARLQETARFVMSVVEPDVQLAGLMGYSNNAVVLDMRQAGAAIFAPDGMPVGSKHMKVGSAAISGVPAVLNDCGNNYVFDLLSPIRADNGTWGLGCGAEGGGFVTGTDTLTIRRTEASKATSSVAVAGRIQIYSNRLALNNSVFWDGTTPGPVKDKDSEVRDLVMQAYYVSKDSDGRPGLPSLRLKQIAAKAGAGEWKDQEIVRGVEDFQVELGIDTGADNHLDGVADDDLGDGMIDNVNGDVRRYVQPGDATLARAQVTAVRIWVRVRAEEQEPGFKDNRTYKYGSTNFTASDGYRRVVMSRTIFVRNARTFPSSGT